MNSKRRQLPLEVSSWMEKDLTLKRITANSRLLTNDTRPNIVLSRQFFSNLLTLSYARYRKIAEHDFDKKLFLRNQYNKVESSMPDLLPYLDRSGHNMNRVLSSRMLSSRTDDNPLLRSSVQSSLSRQGTRLDSTFTRRKQQPTRSTKTSEPIKPQPDITPISNAPTPTNQRMSTRQQMSRERINRLAQPKGFRPKFTNNEHVRLYKNEEQTTPEDLFGTIEQMSQISSTPIPTTSLEKPKSAIDDKRFRHLVDVFSEVHKKQTSNLQTVKNIVQANASLQDEEGQWKNETISVISRETKLQRDQEMLANRLKSRLDVFLIDVGA